MKWNIAPESVSLVILGIIWFYSRNGSHLSTLKNKIFQGCLMITFSAMLTNILSTVMIYHYQSIPLWMTWLVTIVYYIFTPLMGLLYFMYVASVVYENDRRLAPALYWGLVPAALYTLIVLTNPFHKKLFYLNAEEGYGRGGWVILTYLIFYVYCVASIIVTAVNHKRMERKICQILAAFPVLAMLVIVVQQLFPEIILSGSAATCALLIIYLYLQNRQISMDYLTGAPNRQELLDTLGLMLHRRPEEGFTVAVISLRDFRQVNNTCGQHRGDMLLRNFCHFLCELTSQEKVYRFSGDEFAVLFSKDNEGAARQFVSQVMERMKEPWRVEEYRFLLSAVAGIVRHIDPEETLDHVIGSIEYAVAQVKTGKYGKMCYCDQEMLDKLERRRQVIRILKDKLEDESFEMFYQPIYSIAEGKFLYAESLMRINNSPIGPIYPSEFIPIAEETGLIIELTYVILDKVCKFVNHLLAQGLPMASIHVNYSGYQFSQPDLTGKTLAIINKNGTPASALKIEFTESTLAESSQVVTDFALEMRKNGIMMGLDDFGTGYSNIATVLNIPFGTIKLDRSLICASVENRTSALAVRHLVQTFKDLGMKVVAEGVETEEQRQMVVDFGVDQIQGFFYSKPLSPDAMEIFLREHETGNRQ